MNSKQKAEWIESQFGVVFAERLDQEDSSFVSSLTEQEVVKIVDKMFGSLVDATMLLNKLIEEKTAAIAEFEKSIPSEIRDSAKKVQAVLDARLRYINEPNERRRGDLAGVWLDLEDELTNEEYAHYIIRWQASAPSMEMKQRLKELKDAREAAKTDNAAEGVGHEGIAGHSMNVVEHVKDLTGATAEEIEQLGGLRLNGQPVGGSIVNGRIQIDVSPNRPGEVAHVKAAEQRWEES